MEKLDDDTINNLLSVDWDISDDDLDSSDLENDMEDDGNFYGIDDEQLEGKEFK